MFPYVLTFIAVAVFPLALAGYGGHLATLALPESSWAKKKALAIVWGLAIIGIALFGISQILSYRSDKARDGKDEEFRADVNRKLDNIFEEGDPAKRKVEIGELRSKLSGQKAKGAIPSSSSASPPLPAPQAPVYTPLPTPTLSPYHELQRVIDEVNDLATE